MVLSVRNKKSMELPGISSFDCKKRTSPLLEGSAGEKQMSGKKYRNYPEF